MAESIQLRAPYNLLRDKILPALAEHKIIKPPTEEFIMSYYPPVRVQTMVRMFVELNEESEDDVASVVSSNEVALDNVEVDLSEE